MVKQGTKAWLQQRVGRVTGSNVGAVLGSNPYKTPDDVIRQMVRDYHGADPEFKGNAATSWGSFNEEGAQAEYTMETGNAVEECGFFAYWGWLGASPDGLLEDGGVIEIKAPYGQRDKNPPVFKTAEEQPHYWAQMQIEMYCTSSTWCHFYQWAPHGSLLETVHIDNAWLQWAIPTLKEFYEHFLEEIDNPDHLAPKRPEINTLHAEKLVSEYSELQDAIERADERRKEVLAEIVKLAKGANALVCGHKLTKVERRGSVSYAKAIAKYAPDADLEPFRGKSSTNWTIK